MRDLFLVFFQEAGKILEDIKTRDDRDMNRKLNPLKIADGAALVDSTDINIDEVVEEILSNIEER